MAGEFKFEVIDATRPVHKQQKDVRKLVNNVLKGWRGLTKSDRISQKLCTAAIKNTNALTIEGEKWRTLNFMDLDFLIRKQESSR